MLLKQKIPSLPRNFALGTFGKLIIVFSTKVYLLHLIKQNYLPKTFLRTVIMMEKVSGPDCIPVVVPKNCEPELHTLAELFNKFVKESCFPDCWKISSVVSVFKNVGERLLLKTTTL